MEPLIGVVFLSRMSKNSQEFLLIGLGKATPIMRLLFCSIRCSMQRKGQKMKELKDFDYEFKVTEENASKKYWVHMKGTSELVEVSQEVLNFLRCEERELRRDMSAVYKRGGPDLSYDAHSGVDQDSSWLVDPHDLETGVIEGLNIKEFQSTLTAFQRSVLEECILGGKTHEEYAQEHGIGKSAVSKHTMLIRKKAKYFFGDGGQKAKK